MSSEQENIELIERFFRQELSEDELLSFENRVRQDPSFSKEVIMMRDIFYSVKMAARVNLKEELQEIQNEALSQPTKSYNPGIKKWFKWITVIVVTAAIVGVGYNYLDKSYIEKFKSIITVKDSVAVYDTTMRDVLPPGAASETIIKDPSDPRYNGMQADIKLEVEDPSTFAIMRIGKDSMGLYKYEISADGKRRIVRSTNPRLAEELMKKRDESINSNETENRPKVKNDTLRRSVSPQRGEIIEGVDN